MASELLSPRHTRNRGEEGYRTPTIEDTQNDLGAFPFPSRGGQVREAHTSALEALNQPSYQRAEAHGNKERRRRREVDWGTAKIGWKGRLRHFTWAYFTLTMATGGIANVLYFSKSNILTLDIRFVN